MGYNCAVLAAGLAMRTARRWPTAHTHYRQQQTMLAYSVQNNTGPLGEPVINTRN